MKKLSTTFATLALLGASATAMSAATELDADGDGMLTFAELQAGFPDLTEETFATMDGNGDGMLDGDELAAAQDAGMIPTEG